jgi:hypothetical protein
LSTTMVTSFGSMRLPRNQTRFTRAARRDGTVAARQFEVASGRSLTTTSEPAGGCPRSGNSTVCRVPALARKATSM